MTIAGSIILIMLGGVAGLLFGIYRISVTRRAVAPVDEPVHRHEIVEEPEVRRTTVYEDRRRYDEPPL